MKPGGGGANRFPQKSLSVIFSKKIPQFLKLSDFSAFFPNFRHFAIFFFRKIFRFFAITFPNFFFRFAQSYRVPGCSDNTSLTQIYATAPLISGHIGSTKSGMEGTSVTSWRTAPPETLKYSVVAQGLTRKKIKKHQSKGSKIRL